MGERGLEPDEQGTGPEFECLKPTESIFIIHDDSVYI